MYDWFLETFTVDLLLSLTLVTDCSTVSSYVGDTPLSGKPKMQAEIIVFCLQILMFFLQLSYLFVTSCWLQHKAVMHMLFTQFSMPEDLIL